MDRILTRLTEETFSVNNCVMLQLNSDEAIKFYADKEGDSVLPFLMEHLVSGPILAMELISNNAVRKLLEVTGRQVLCHG